MRIDDATVDHWRDIQAVMRCHRIRLRLQASRLDEPRLHDVADLMEQAGQGLDALILDLSAEDREEKGGEAA